MNQTTSQSRQDTTTARRKTKDLSLEAMPASDDQKEHSFLDSPLPLQRGREDSSPRQSTTGDKNLSLEDDAQSSARGKKVPPKDKEQRYDPQYFVVNELSDEQTTHDYWRHFLHNLFPGNESFQDDQGVGLIMSTTLMLSVVFFVSVILTFFLNPSNWRFWFAISRIALFHICDFFLTARNQPDLVTYKSFFLFNPVFHPLRLFFIVEYWVWKVFAPGFINSKLATTIGVIAAIGAIAGQIIRIVSMWQLKEGFTYCLAQKKRDNHELVTGGVYEFVRHPSYSGVLLLFSSTALLLWAPASALYAIFTNQHEITRRCDVEEKYLGNMFGQQYQKYQQRVPWRLIPYVY